jgi:hypothetical protein
MSEQVPEGSHERLVGRLRQLADAVTQGRDAVAREFTMRVPAEPERDADLVLSKAADEIDRLRAEVEALRALLFDAAPLAGIDTPQGMEWALAARAALARTTPAEKEPPR